MKKLSLLCFLLCCAGSTVMKAQVALTTLNAPYEQNFNSLGTAASNDVGTLPAGWLFLETGTNANTTYGAGTGSSNTGNTYSYGLDASDRAFGGLLSGSLTPTLGAFFINQTGTTVTSLTIAYRGEQWRLGAGGRGSDRLDFEISTDATSLTSGTWTAIDNLDFNSPVTTGTARALDGNQDANSATITFTLEGLTIGNGAVFFIRWTDFNAANADDGLAIDNFSITPSGIPADEPSIAVSPASLAFGEVVVPATTTLSYEVKGANLDEPITITSAHAAYSLSTDATSFSSSVALPDTGGVVFVRFAPLMDGGDNTVIAHTSGTTTKGLAVTGSGFIQADHIIPIATARAASTGTRVTVAGRITVANEHGNPAFVQDATGGIPVFDAALAHGVSIGDSVIVTGPIGLFNDQKQISGAGIFYTRIATAPRVIAPKPISLTDLAANEGLLVTVQQVSLVNQDLFFYPQSTERITDGATQADLRIDGDTNIPGLAKPQGVTSITGVVGRFRTNAQLLPRFESDVPGVAPYSIPSDTIARTKTLDVVNWNLEFFGARSEDYRNEEYGPEDEALQLENVRRVLDTLRADIIAVQEISDEALLAALVDQLGHYAFTCSQRYSYSFQGPSDEFPPQKVCFIYDTTTITVRGARAMFESLYDSARNGYPSLLPGYPEGASSFYSSGRLPYQLTVDVTIDGVTETITLIDIHAKSGATAADRSRRLYDAAVLKDSLDADATLGNLIILGDLNDDLDQSIVTGLGSPYASFVSDTAYVAVTKALSDAGARSTVSFGDVIDHQILSNDLKDEYVNGSAQVVPPFRLVTSYATTTSDHLPVITRYTLQAPEATFVQQNAALTEDSTGYTVHILLSKPVTRDLQLYIALSGNATYGSDFTTQPAASGNVMVLNLAAGNTSAFFTITVLNDAADELPETAVFTLQPGTGIETGTQPVFTLSIEDNDIPVVSFKDRYAASEEGADAHTVKLKLSSAVASDQTVTLSLYSLHNTVYGTDYITSPAAENGMVTVTVPAGSNEAQFTITALADRKREMPWELISFYLDDASDGLIAAQPRLFIFTIIDVRWKPDFTIFPNPTHGPVSITCEGLEDDEKINAELRSPHGELLLRKRGTLDALDNLISIKLENGRRGVYTLKLTVDDESYLFRIVRN